MLQFYGSLQAVKISADGNAVMRQEMKTNILEYLQEAVEKNPAKTAYFDESTTYTYERLYKNTQAVASKLIKKLNTVCRPILVYMEKTPHVLSAFWGTVASRNFY